LVFVAYYLSMSKTNIIAREEECRKLSMCLLENEAQLVVVTGRRRVGKTFLINEYFDGNYKFKITGAHNESTSAQLDYFRIELLARTGKDVGQISNWRMAFFHLQSYLSSLPKEEKKIVFFDEMPWLDTHKSGFLKAFEHFWNDFGSALHNLVFIVAGSATSWITEKILHNKGGLYNRKTLELAIKPFTLEETERYLLSRGIHYSRYHIAVIYMCIGGIPYYLRMIDNAYDPLQNIDLLFFGNDAKLKGEFKSLFETLFKRDRNYIDIIELLATKRKGYSLDEIAKGVNNQVGGSISSMLNNLLDAGLIRKNPHYLGRKRDLYQLCDHFSLFYLSFVQGKPNQQSDYFSKNFLTPSTEAWLGFTFELLCRTHLDAIRFALGIYAIDYQAYGFDKSSENGRPGSQIDLVIERKDKVVHLCEMKFSRSEYEIDANYWRNINQKMAALSSHINKHSSMQLTFITVCGVKDNIYRGYVNQSLTIDDLFIHMK